MTSAAAALSSARSRRKDTVRTSGYTLAPSRATMWKKWKRRRLSSWAVTKVPLPWRRTSACSATRLSTAFLTVPIATRNPAASACSVGIGSPARHRAGALPAIQLAPVWSLTSRWPSTRMSTTSRPSVGKETTMELKTSTFLGYPRDNGRVGVRNHVIILPVDDLSNAACEAVANNIKGAMAIPHPYGRLQFGADLELHFKTLIGTGSNPNVAAVVVIGIEDAWAKEIAAGIAKTGKPVAFFGIEGHGNMETIHPGSKAAKNNMHWAW